MHIDLSSMIDDPYNAFQTEKCLIFDLMIDGISHVRLNPWLYYWISVQIIDYKSKSVILFLGLASKSNLQALKT